jgi:hypothetical protein
MSATINGRAATFRWAMVNGRRSKNRHLWLGQATACGLTMTPDGGTIYSLDIAHPHPVCAKCAAYAQGWLDRHDHGARPALNVPNPLGAHSRIEPTS